MTGFLATVTVLLPFADPDLSYPLPDGADMRIAHPSRTHGPGCRAAVFSRDGTKLATVSDRTVLVREWPGGRRLIEIHFPRIANTAGVAFSPDGRLVAAWETGFSSVTVGDLRTGDDWRLDVVEKVSDQFRVSHVAFASNGVLRVLGEQLTDRLSPTGNYESVDFDPARETPVARRELPGRPLAVAADGSAAILKVDGGLRRYDTTVQRPTGPAMPLPANGSEAVSADAECRRIAYTGKDHLFVVDSRTGKRLLAADPSPWAGSGWTTPILSADGTELAGINRVTPVHPLTVKRWDVATGKPRPDIRNEARWDQPSAVVGSVTLTVFDSGSRFAQFDRITGKRTDPPTQLLGFAASQNGKWLAGYDGNTLVTRDAVSGRVVRRENRLGQPTSHMTVSDDGKQLHVDPKRNRVTIPGTDRWAELEGERLMVYQTQDGGAITSLVYDAPVPPKDEHEWGEAFQLVASADGRVYAVARKMHVDLFDPEFRHLRRIQVVPLRDQIGRQMFHDITEYATGVALSPDGRRVAIGKYVAVRGMPLGTEFFIHEVATGERVAHIDYVYGDRTPLSFTPNGRHLWTAGNGVALRYDLKPGPVPVFDRRNVLAELRGENASLADLAAGRLASPGMLKWLGEQLPPDKQPDPKRVAELVRQLADRDFQVRETATAALIELGPGVVPAMKDVQKVAISPEAKRRATLVLNRLGGESSPDVLLRTRAVIAVAMLAEDGNAAARKLLEGWSKGMPGSPLTEDARAALARLPK